jgi:hypothetical protein
MSNPLDELVCVGVPADARQLRNLRGYMNRFAKELYFIRAFNERAPERAVTLNPYKEHGIVRIPESVLEMVLNPASFAHAACGEDYLGARVGVDAHGFLAGFRNGQSLEIQRVDSASTKAFASSCRNRIPLIH